MTYEHTVKRVTHSILRTSRSISWVILEKVAWRTASASMFIRLCRTGSSFIEPARLSEKKAQLSSMASGSLLFSPCLAE